MNKTVRIGFSTPRAFNPVSWAVRKLTGSRASHAFFVYYDVDFDMDVVLEAHELGFRLTPRKAFERGNRIVKLVTPRHALDVGLKYVAQRYLGSMYDFAGLVGMVVVMFGRWLRRRWRNPFRGSKNVYCSEAVIIAMKASAGYEGLKLSSESSPQDLLNYFEQVEQA
jgi:hypothetical protein